MSDGFRSDLKDRARRDFIRAQRVEGRQSARSEFNARVLEAAGQRIDRIRHKLTGHIDRNKERWTQAELTKLQKANPHRASHALADGPKAPFGLSYKGPMHNRSLREQARANVEHRCELRQRGLDRAQQRLMRTLSRTHSQS